MLESVKETCCGCSACASICPKSAISMIPNIEGFLYPQINESICIQCGACEKTCPILQVPSINTNKMPIAYAVQNKNTEIRMDSTSGGAFTAIARFVLQKKGVVFGAKFNEKFEVTHNYVEAENDLTSLRRSKYVQSRIGNTYQQAKDFLKQDRWVCFSGTPCQIAGLKNYLKKDYEKLVTVDIACHGVPSPKFWDKYRDFQEKKFSSKIDFVDFRYKKNGYSSSVMAIRFQNGKEYYRGHESDYMLKAFFSEIVSRKSCFDCHFKSVQRVSDFTIFDCWSVGNFSKKMDDNKGATTLMIQSEKGESIWNSIVSDVVNIRVQIETAINLDGDMIIASKTENPKRSSFFADMESMDFKSLCNRYIPVKAKDHMKRILKPFFYKIGLLKVLNEMVKKKP